MVTLGARPDGTSRRCPKPSDISGIGQGRRRSCAARPARPAPPA